MKRYDKTTILKSKMKVGKNINKFSQLKLRPSHYSFLSMTCNSKYAVDANRMLQYFQLYNLYARSKNINF